MTTCDTSLVLTMIADFAVRPNERWFSSTGCVVHRGEDRDVFVGGTLIGTFGMGEGGARNAILIGLMADEALRVGRLAAAFGVVPETLRLLRKLHQHKGLGALVARKRGGSESKVTPKLRARMDGMFEAGLGATAVHGKLRGRLSHRTVTYALAAWRAQGAAPAAVAQLPIAVQIAMPLEAANDADPALSSATQDAVGSSEEGTEEAQERIAAVSPRAGRFVQHLGTWIMLASVAQLGLHRRADEVRGVRVEQDALRIAIDSVVCALSVGEGCVEGVRRLATPSAPTLLRAEHAPSSTWTRRLLGRFADSLGAVRLHLGMSLEYIEAARVRAGDHPVVFYIDNHMRPYTGAHTVRRGWRMQDKCVRPGISDYYIHDEDGRPVLRIDVPSHDSLTSWLSPLARQLRGALGPDVKILLAFDRAGSFPEQMASLREENFDFVTYERKPFSLLSPAAFHDTVTLDGETIEYSDARTNLGKARGRVRRIALRMPDGRQVNLVAISEQDVPWLIGVMRGRWVQENAFKHGVERWGINQLDGRKVHPYPPDTIIPNPARRRLDRALRLARLRDGEARRGLASLPPNDARRARIERDLAEAIVQQRHLLDLRPSTPQKAALADTELAGKLVKHDSNYKAAIDAIRIACANAETDLAGELAPFLPRPAEAKRVLRNLFAAPGHVRLGMRTITVTLLPAANVNELLAFGRLLDILSRANLTLPSDPLRRRLRFRSQIS